MAKPSIDSTSSSRPPTKLSSRKPSTRVLSGVVTRRVRPPRETSVVQREPAFCLAELDLARTAGGCERNLIVLRPRTTGARRWAVQTVQVHQTECPCPSRSSAE